MTKDANGEYPYDAAETFTIEDIDKAKHFRSYVKPRIGRPDHCPHDPRCPNVTVCLEEIAWYIRHMREIESELTTHTVVG